MSYRFILYEYRVRHSQKTICYSFQTFQSNVKRKIDAKINKWKTSNKKLLFNCHSYTTERRLKEKPTIAIDKERKKRIKLFK